MFFVSISIITQIIYYTILYFSLFKCQICTISQIPISRLKKDNIYHLPMTFIIQIYQTSSQGMFSYFLYQSHNNTFFIFAKIHIAFIVEDKQTLTFLFMVIHTSKIYQIILYLTFILVSCQPFQVQFVKYIVNMSKLVF